MQRVARSPHVLTVMNEPSHPSAMPVSVSSTGNLHSVGWQNPVAQVSQFTAQLLSSSRVPDPSLMVPRSQHPPGCPMHHAIDELAEGTTWNVTGALAQPPVVDAPPVAKPDTPPTLVTVPPLAAA